MEYYGRHSPSTPRPEPCNIIKDDHKLVSQHGISSCWYQIMVWQITSLYSMIGGISSWFYSPGRCHTPRLGRDTGFQ